MSSLVFATLLTLGITSIIWSLAFTLPEMQRRKHAERMLNLRDELWEAVHLDKCVGASDREDAERLQFQLEMYAMAMRRLTTPHEVAHLLKVYRHKPKSAPNPRYQSPRLSEVQEAANGLLVDWFKHRPAGHIIRAYRLYRRWRNGNSNPKSRRPARRDSLRHARLMARAPVEPTPV